MAKILLLDGPAIAYRSHYALAKANLTTPDGKEVAATHGYATTLLKLLREVAPDYACAAFDTEEPTYRHELFEEYKADRPGMPDELAGQMEWIEAVTEGLGIRVVAVAGYEADDVIATVASRARAREIETVIATGDKDMLQIVDDGTRVIMLSGWGRGTKSMDRRAVQDKYGVTPDLLPDYFGLMGDAIDNVKGVPGIGAKTAGKLVKEYGALEDIYKDLEDVTPPRVRKILEENREAAFQSRELVTVHREVPLPLSLEDLKVGKVGGSELQELLGRLGFRKLARKIFPAADPVEVTPEVWRQGDKSIPHVDVAAVDVNIDGASAVTSGILGVAVCCEGGGDHYFPLGHREPGNIDGGALSGALECFLAAGVTRVAYDAKRVNIGFKRLGLGLPAIDFDTMLAAYLLDPGRADIGVEDIASDYLGESLSPEAGGRGSDETVTVRRASENCCRRARVSLRARKPLEEDLRGKGLEKLYRDVEMPLVEVLADMEMRGIRIDRKRLESLSDELEKRMVKAEQEAHALAGRPFNLNSTRDVAEVLFNEIGLKPGRKTKTGFSTDMKVLAELASEHELPGKILDYRQTAKLKSSHVDQLLDFAGPGGDRIHACFHQTVTSTGRLSSSDPNLQNVPIRGDLGKEIRKAFVPSGPDWVLISADYSQIELRILAHLSGDHNLVEAFRDDKDIHATTAAFIFKVEPTAVTPSMRTVAKAVNFGIIYGMGPHSLARNTGLPMEEASRFMKEHKQTYPGVYDYITRTLEQGRETGCVETLLGRKRYVPGLAGKDSAARSAAERMAINAPVQGSAADIIKIAMLEIFTESKEAGLAGGILVQIHDEILVDCPESEKDRFAGLLREKMSSAFHLSVPLKVEVGYGKNWYEAH